MGAKNHGIIMPDANKNATLNQLVGAAFGAAGQRCMALPVSFRDCQNFQKNFYISSFFKNYFKMIIFIKKQIDLQTEVYFLKIFIF
jgi:hypothetical protein